MKILILLTALIHQLFANNEQDIDHYLPTNPYEYRQNFAEITLCNNPNQKAYPFCASVDESPINLTAKALYDGERIDCNEPIDWDYNDRKTFDVEKKEHTIEVLVPDGVAEFKNPVIPDTSVNAVPKFCLEQVHFHWDDDDPNLGSEHSVGNKKYPLEAHFVHYNCARGSVGGVQKVYPNKGAIDTAKAAKRDVHELGVIGVFFNIEGDKANPAIDRILDAADEIAKQEAEHCQTADSKYQTLNCAFTKDELNRTTKSQKEDMEKIQKDREKILVKKGMDGIDLSDILTEDMLENGYWTYEGSLTTPPCTDDVRWFNIKQESYISKSQWKRFTRIKRPCQEQLIAPNWRPIQNNENPVFSCKYCDDRKDGKDGFFKKMFKKLVGDSDDSKDSKDSGD